jgi:hypothetical protein
MFLSKNWRNEMNELEPRGFLVETLFVDDQPEQIVVGLSGEQIDEFFDVLDYSSSVPKRTQMKSWMRTKNFAQPEVKEIVVGLNDKQIIDLFLRAPKCKDARQFKDAYKEWAKTQTFAQQEVKEIVVGLTDEQIKRLSWELDGKASKSSRKVIEDYLKPQTFSQSQSFEPNWDDIDSDISIVLFSENYYSENGDSKGAKSLFQYERPKPAEPTVEVGQNYKYVRESEYENGLFEIIAVLEDGKLIVLKETSGLGYINKSYENLIAKFYRVA